MKPIVSSDEDEHVTTPEIFTAVRFTERLPGGEVIIDWPTAASVQVVVALLPDGPASHFERHFVGRPAHGDRLQAALGALPMEVATDGEPRFSLTLRSGEGAPTTISWSEPEPPKLLAVRTELEAMGHVAWVQARALYRRAMAARHLSHWSEALADLQRGIRLIGNSYQLPGTVDSTGQRMALALGHERSGKADAACAVYATVLRSRLTSYLMGHAPGEPNERWEE